MRLLQLVNEVENRIHAGEQYVAGELAAFYSGLHAIYATERLALESELQALRVIADRIFDPSLSDSGVPPSPVPEEEKAGGDAETPQAAGVVSEAPEATSLVAPAEISAPQSPESSVGVGAIDAEAVNNSGTDGEPAITRDTGVHTDQA